MALTNTWGATNKPGVLDPVRKCTINIKLTSVVKG